MKDLTCPYCKHEFDWDGDYPEQDEEMEIQCPKCEKYFKAHASWMLIFSDTDKVAQ